MAGRVAHCLAMESHLYRNQNAKKSSQLLQYGYNIKLIMHKEAERVAK